MAATTLPPRGAPLPASQRFLRHVKSVYVRNLLNSSSSLIPSTVLKIMKPDGSLIFKSYTTSGTVNPMWMLSSEHDPNEQLAKTPCNDLFVQVETEDDGEPLPLFTGRLLFASLVSLGFRADRLAMLENLPLNTVLLEMSDGVVYSSVAVARLVQAVPASPTPKSRPSNAARTKPYDVGMVLSVLPRLLAAQNRLRTVRVATQAFKERTEEQLKDKDATQTTSDKMVAASQRVAALKLQIIRQRQTVVSDRNCSRLLRARLAERAAGVSNGLRHLMDAREAKEAQYKRVTHIRSVYIRVNHFLEARRLKLLAQLQDIYPIVTGNGGSGSSSGPTDARGLSPATPRNKGRGGRKQQAGVHTIRGLRLPTSELESHDEDYISTALGYACHLVFLIAKYLQVPLRFPLLHGGSRSCVTDPIYDGRLAAGNSNVTLAASLTLGGPGDLRTLIYPLYWRGVGVQKFERAVKYLHHDVDQIMFARGIRVDRHHRDHLLRKIVVIFEHEIVV